MTKKYKVVAQEVYTSEYHVDADSEEAAIKAVQGRDADLQRRKYDRPLTTAAWEVKEVEMKTFEVKVRHVYCKTVRVRAAYVIDALHAARDSQNNPNVLSEGEFQPEYRCSPEGWEVEEVQEEEEQ